ncbi:MAG: hypothetical protein ABIS47_03825 [Acidimicrobiales bacterium]
MLRRTLWLAVGAGLGAWMVLKVQRAAAQLTPSGAAAEVGRRLRHLRLDLAAALAEGRRAKLVTEAELRQAGPSVPVIDVAARPSLTAAARAEEGGVRR